MGSNLAKFTNITADISNMDTTLTNNIASNLAKFTNITADISNMDTTLVSQGSRLLDLETMGSGSVWFDAVRTTSLDISSWTNISYTNVSESNAGAMDVGTGVFTAPLAGTYQFILQAFKDVDVDAFVRLLVDGTTVSKIVDRDEANAATITGTLIVELQPGQKVWADTYDKLVSSSDGLIHFTGVLITPK